MRLTKNFKSEEFIVSKQYPEVAEKIKLGKYDIMCIRLLCESILQPIRDEFGLTIITSGKRNEELNSLVDGAEDSDHLTSNAADIYVPEAEVEEVIDFIDYMALPYRQMQRVGNSGLHLSINIPGKTFKKEYLRR